MTRKIPEKNPDDNSRMLAHLAQIQRQMTSDDLNEEIMREARDIFEKLGPRQVGTVNVEHPTVSLCMITKNEEAHLARCLASVRDIVEEIIVVDTGSTDRTREIAETFRARVFQYDWTDDFSQARNVSLEKADGDWIFVLDADEVIGKSDQLAFRKLLTQHRSKPVAYQFDTRNYCNEINVVGWIARDGGYPEEEAGNGWTSSWKARLFPNHPEIRFHYPIHELVEPSFECMDVELKTCNIPIHHYGKLVQKTTEAKKETYYQLGKKKLSDFSGNPGALREMAIQAGIVGEHQEAAELWRRYIGMCPQDCVGLVFLATSYGQLGQYEKAVEAAQQAVLLNPSNIEARYNLGLFQFFTGKTLVAMEAFQEVLDQQRDYLPAAFMLATSYCCVGKPEEGMRRLEVLKQTALAPELPSRCLELTKGLLTNQMLDPAIALLEAAIETEVALDGFQSLLSSLHRVRESSVRD